MKRSTFIKRMTAGISLFALHGLIACSEDSSGNGADDNGGNGDTNSNLEVAVTSVTANHDHNNVSMTMSDVESETPGTYTLRGGTHTHPFTASISQMQSLKAGQSVQLNATGAHNHTITLVVREIAVG